MAEVSIMQEQLSTDRHRLMAEVSIMQEQLSARTSCASSLLHIAYTDVGAWDSSGTKSRHVPLCPLSGARHTAHPVHKKTGQSPVAGFYHITKVLNRS
jgi:hypothetical protein